MRRRVSVFVLLLLVWSSLVVSHAAAGVSIQDELPAGRGKDILEASCTACHGLEEITNLKGKMTREEWRGIVKMMTDYGAQVDPKDVDVLVDYLDRNLGKRP